MRFSSYKIGKVQQAFALAAFYSALAMVLSSILGLLAFNPRIFVALIAIYGALLVWMSLNVCKSCGASIFDQSGHYPLSVSNMNSLASPSRTCARCSAHIPD